MSVRNQQLNRISKNFNEIRYAGEAILENNVINEYCKYMHFF